MSGITVDDSDGDSEGGHNTDAFDVGDSNDVTITGATVYNQDDCLAVNSGTVRGRCNCELVSFVLMLLLGYHLHERILLRRTWSFDRKRRRKG